MGFQLSKSEILTWRSVSSFDIDENFSFNIDDNFSFKFFKVDKIFRQPWSSTLHSFFISTQHIYALNFWKFSKLNPGDEKFKAHSPHMLKSNILTPTSKNDRDVSSLTTRSSRCCKSWRVLYCQLFCVHMKRILHKSV